MAAENVNPSSSIFAHVNVVTRKVENVGSRFRVKPCRRKLRRVNAHIAGGAGFLLLCTCLACSRSATATSIVVIRVPDRVVMAADSKGTFVDVGKTTQEVCKIYRSGGSFFAVAGFANDPVTRFSLSGRVIAASKDRASIASKIDAIESKMKPLMEREAYLLRKRPEPYKDLVDPEQGGATVIFIGVEKGIPVTEAVRFAPDLSEPNTVHFKYRTDGCPGNCPYGTKRLWVGAHNAIDRFVTHPQEMSSPEIMAWTFVQLEINDDSTNVGGPIDLVSMKDDGSYRIYSKHNCPAN